MDNRIDAVYARQSVDKKDSISIESQLDFCKYELKGAVVKSIRIRVIPARTQTAPIFKNLCGILKRASSKELLFTSWTG